MCTARLQVCVPAFVVAWEFKELTCDYLRTGCVLDRTFAILTKWFSLTRLETRTKESNIYASIWV
jgi:hypothetical protein